MMKHNGNPCITTKNINLACYLSSKHGLLVQVEVKKVSKRTCGMQLTFTNPYIRKIKKLYEPDKCYVNTKSMKLLFARISEMLDENKRKNYQRGLILAEEYEKAGHEIKPGS